MGLTLFCHGWATLASRLGSVCTYRVTGPRKEQEILVEGCICLFVFIPQLFQLLFTSKALN